MKLKIYQVDTFTDKLFAGNPAAVCPLEDWLADNIMQNIAMENNLAETAFYIKKGNQYHIRWFTPVTEVDLCGHATLATAFVLYNYEDHPKHEIHFHSPRSGSLTVNYNGQLLSLDFPVDEFKEVTISETMKTAFGIAPQQVFRGKTDYMFIFGNEEEIKTLKPKLDLISSLGGRGSIATAKGNKVDFVSRFFAPQSGIDEDPVTGSAHTTLIPYWAKKLGKDYLTASQLSPRGGSLKCRYLGHRVEISGQCKLYMMGNISIE